MTVVVVFARSTEVTAVARRMHLISVPVRKGATDRSKAIDPATCGEAIEVPSSVRNPLVPAAERTDTPGAQASGLMTSESGPAQTEGPRLLKLAIGKLAVVAVDGAAAKILTAVVIRFLGGVQEDGLGPLLPAENTTAVPSASTASITA